MLTDCSQCHQKEDLINKYLKLIKLLKAKCQKTAKSFVKNNTLPSDTLYETSLENSGSLSSNIKLNCVRSNLINPEKVITSDQQLKGQAHFLALTIVVNRSTKALLKHPFSLIRESTILSLPSNPQPDFPALNLPSINSIHSIIQETLSFGKSLQIQSNFPNPNQKSFYSRLFDLEVRNAEYVKKITLLEKAIAQQQKRFMKETEKKRESLQTVAEEIRQKTDQVIELQHTIKRYEKALGKSLDNVDVESVLEEDAEEMRKTCMRLQSINEKLNDDVRNLQQNLDTGNKQLILIRSQNALLKKQNNLLKQQLFEISHQLSEQQHTQKLYKNLLKKLNNKIQTIKLNEKKLYSSLKMSGNIVSKIVSTRNTEESAEEDNENNDVQIEKVEKKYSLRQLQAQQKIEQLFAFLFHIKKEDYKITNEGLFDEDETELLNSHKEIFLSSAKEESFMKVKRESLKKSTKMNDESNFHQTDELFYVNRPQLSSQDSVLCALQPAANIPPQPTPLSAQSTTKLIALQIQKSKLIEKISQLKNLHMHIRNVILNFLKSIELTNLKPESGSILDVVFQFFEYSEDEKVEICKEKKKKFWGFM